MRWSVLPSFIVGMCSLFGCMKSEPSYQLKGTVTYGGEPIPVGRIFFEPDAAAGNTGVQGFARIEKGQFNTTMEGGAGVKGGPYVIRVLGFDGNKSDDFPDGKPLFDEYETKKELRKENADLTIDIPKKKK